MGERKAPPVKIFSGTETKYDKKNIEAHHSEYTKLSL